MASGSRLLVQQVKHVTIVNFGDSAIMDALHIQQLAEELYTLVDKQDRRALVLDFSKVQFLSSQALGVLLTLRKKLTTANGRCVISGMDNRLKKVFKISKLDSLFEFHDDQRKALAVFDVYIPA